MSARLVESALAATDVLTLDGHGLETNDRVLVRATDGGELPAPLAEGTTYFAIRLTESTFQLAAAADGPAIDLTTDGVSVVVAVPLPFDDVLEFYSRFVDPYIPAHMTPLEAPIPIVGVGTVATLAAKRLQILAGHTSESMTELEAGAQKLLERWSKGIPLRDAAATASANLAVTVPSSGRDPRGWGSGTLP
jgi:hypothetical protein